MQPAFIFIFAILCSTFPPQGQTNSGNWDSWQFLLGEWTAEGAGEPGQGTGTFSFNLDLQGKVLVRKSRADYPATKDRPANSHEDLMVIYSDPGGTLTRAIYFDNEGHIIHYRTEFSEGQTTLMFLSDPVPSAPRFRLTTTKGKNGTLIIKFEIAPPGNPDLFSTFVQGIAHRAPPHPVKPKT